MDNKWTRILTVGRGSNRRTVEIKVYDSVAKVKRCVIPLAKKYGILRVSLFGSRARGDFRRDSDYDLLILYPPDMPFYVKTRFVTELIHALGENVDIIGEDSIRPEFYERISGDLKVIYTAL